jgi:pimeloyl-ACP methyl ester carboxylesterase
MLNYEVVGEEGPWIVLTPGGRGDLDGIRYLGNRLAKEGYRILLHDRRNCGASEIRIEGELSEQEIWTDDVYALLKKLEATPVIAGGGSAGCRLSLLLALRHPEAVRGLLLWWITGGAVASTHLGHAYYGQFIEAAEKGGMEAVCQTDYFAARIDSNPHNRTYLLKLNPLDFIDTMSSWRDYFIEGARLPVIGASEKELESINLAACIVPGNDAVHPQSRGEHLHRLLSGSEIHYIRTAPEQKELAGRDPKDIMRETGTRLGNIFVEFLSKNFQSKRK